MASLIDSATLEKQIGYQFVDQNLVVEALTHTSHSANHYELLEYLGDSLLGAVISVKLCEEFRDASEGQLSVWRTALVRNSTLAEIAIEMGLDKHIRFGPSVNTSDFLGLESVCAEALEAVIGAIYLDSGFAACQETVLHWYGERLAAKQLHSISRDAKSRLQELMQSHGRDLPCYVIIDDNEEDSSARFLVECQLSKPVLRARGKGSNRRSAEQAAAALALQRLETLKAQSDKRKKDKGREQPPKSQRRKS